MSTANELRGVSTGWRNIDNHYRIVPGELTVVTGVPNSGKSEWVDSYHVQPGGATWMVLCVVSLENKVHEHARKLVEKYVGEPWFEGKYSKAPRMNPDTMRTGMKWLNLITLCSFDTVELPAGLDFRISARSRLAPRHSRFTDRSVQRARSLAPDRTDGDGIRLSNARLSTPVSPSTSASASGWAPTLDNCTTGRASVPVCTTSPVPLTSSTSATTASSSTATATKSSVHFARLPSRAKGE